MTHLPRMLCAALVLMLMVPSFAAAGVGDFRTVTGSVTMWGPNYYGSQLAVLQDDEGRQWFVRFPQGVLPNGAAVGTEVTVLGRESVTGNELHALSATLSSSVAALPAGAASGWAVIPGAVQDASGVTALIRSNGGTVLTVDLSQLDASARSMIAPGRGVTVVGVYRADGVLSARGVATVSP
jgi:hypothetical protein